MKPLLIKEGIKGVDGSIPGDERPGSDATNHVLEADITGDHVLGGVETKNHRVTSQTLQRKEMMMSL